MRTQPLVDLARLDLSRTLFGPADLARILKQRGRFAIVDGVLHLDPKNDFIIGFKDVRADDWWAKDHIPGRPIFPGMLMVEASAQLGTFDFFKRHPELENVFVGFVGIDNTRFRATVEPPARLILVGKVLRTRATLFTYRFQGLVEGKIVFESDVTGMRI